MKNQRLNKKKQVHQVFLQNNEMLKKSASVIVFVFVLKFEVYLRKVLQNVCRRLFNCNILFESLLHFLIKCS